MISGNPADRYNPYHTSLTTIYWDEADPELGEVHEETFSAEAELFCCSDFDGQVWAADLCENLSSMRDSGRIATVLLLLGTVTGTWFLVVAYRSMNGDRRNLSSVLLDPRFCLAAGGSTTLAPVVWRIMAMIRSALSRIVLEQDSTSPCLEVFSESAHSS